MEGTAERTAVILGGVSCPAESLEQPLRAVGVTILDRTANSDEIAGLVAQRRPDLLVAAASANGWGWLREAKQREPSLRVVVVGGAADPERIHAAFEAGASAYVVSGAADDDFAVAVRQSFERSLYLEPTADNPPRPAAAATGVRLTRRETEILTRVAHGLSNGEIARAFWLTEQTVKFHLSNVYRKLGVANRTGASRWAHQHGLVSTDPPASVGP